MAENKEKVLILPASHEASPSQLAIILFLKEIGYRPDTIVCSSGGSVAASIACASGFERDPIEFKERCESLSNYISTKLYLRKHKKIITVPFSISALIYPTIYDKGSYPKSKPFDFDLEKQPQLIVGTKDASTNLNTIWYTKEYPSLSHGNYELKKIENIGTYLKVVRASCSIPGIVPPIKINNLKYEDSGMDSVSPFNCISEKYSNECHIIFVSPFDPFNSDIISEPTNNIQETLKEVMGYRKNSKIKKNFKNCLRLLGDDETKIETNSGNTLHDLIIALANIYDTRKSVILIYPNRTHKVNLYNTRNGDYTKAMKNAYKDGFTFHQYMIY